MGMLFGNFSQDCTGNTVGMVMGIELDSQMAWSENRLPGNKHPVVLSSLFYHLKNNHPHVQTLSREVDLNLIMGV